MPDGYRPLTIERFTCSKPYTSIWQQQQSFASIIVYVLTDGTLVYVQQKQSYSDRDDDDVMNDISIDLGCVSFISAT